MNKRLDAFQAKHLSRIYAADAHSTAALYQPVTLSSTARDAHVRFSVIIPTYQRRNLVLAAVRSLASQEFDDRFEVIVVVDGSKDGSAEALRKMDVPFCLIVLEQPNRGRAAACNRGAVTAQGEVILFLDDDMEAHPRLLAEHDRSHREGAEVVLGHMPLHPKSAPNLLTTGVYWWALNRSRRLSSPKATLTLEDLITGQVSLPRATFQRLGGFDTGFDAGFTRYGTYGNEDLDFCYRLLLAGCKIVFNPAAISWQNYVVSAQQYLLEARQAGRADVTFARKYPEQAGTLFELSGSKTWVNRWLRRPLIGFPLLTNPTMAALRWLASTLVESGTQSEVAFKFVSEVRAIEYWRGVLEAGDIPRLRPSRVLAYHAIGEPLGPYGMPYEQFRGQLDALQHAGFQFVSADEFLTSLRGVGGLPRRPVMLTFDDAYKDLAETVLPLLKERGIPAVVFAVSGLLGGTNKWDEAIGGAHLQLLDAPGLRALAQGGVEIGVHSRTHRPLTSLPDKELSEEVEGSVMDLEAAGLERPRLFAYPYGSWDERTRQAVQNAGLQAAFTTDAGRARPGQDPYLVPRIEILRGDSGWKFLWKVITAEYSVMPSEVRSLIPRLV
jgi:peptidoglycan/xylan/chitin deacetylase (PgdA/CDA1 family)/GT2 family glycosyltransferase